MKREEKTIAKNRRAFHDYEVVETFEAGVELLGTEVRSLRENNCQLTDCFALVRNGEVWMHNVHITPFSHGNINNPDPTRSMHAAIEDIRRYQKELAYDVRKKIMEIMQRKRAMRR